MLKSMQYRRNIGIRIEANVSYRPLGGGIDSSYWIRINNRDFIALSSWYSNTSIALLSGEIHLLIAATLSNISISE